MNYNEKYTILQAMNMKRIFDTLIESKETNISVSTLYALSRISLVIVLLLALLILITLYDSAKTPMLIWYMSVVGLLLFRLRDARLFKNKPDTYTLKQWHKRFVIFSLSTAILFSFLGFFFIACSDLSQKYYIIFALLGLSTASIPALSEDMQLNILYSSILLIPISIIILFTHNLHLSVIIFLSFLLYFLSQIFIINKSEEQRQKIMNLESQEKLLHSLFKNAPLGVFTYNKDLEIMDCNETLTSLVDNTKESIIGMNLKDLPDQRPVEIFKIPLSEGENTYKGKYYSKKGKEFWMEAKAFTVNTPYKEDLYGIAIIEDKTKEYLALQKLEYLVNHDILTGLLNRRGLSKSLDDLMIHENHKAYHSILYYLDLNQFKSINDSLGHAMGDNILLEVSSRLNSALDESIVISRLSGDEFVMIAPYVSKDRDDTHHKSKSISNAIEKIFAEPFILEKMHLYLSGSIGVVYIKPNERNREEILRYADLSMYQAKKTKAGIAYYTTSLDRKQKNLFMMQQDLVYAQNNKELKLFFQPIVQMNSNRLFSAEILLRWEHPTQGLLPPDRFISLAIKAGILSKITWWLIENVCQQIAEWKKKGEWKLAYISINISPYQLIENSFPNELLRLLEKYHVEKSEIMLEITERSLIDNFEYTQEVISELKEYGVKCAIDDFGIGYSSLLYLKKLSLDTLKIDRKFAKDTGKNPKELVLMKTILNIGRQFNYNMIIEGIESDTQIDALLAMDESLYYQGYLYSKPLDVKEFTQKFLS